MNNNEVMVTSYFLNTETTLTKKHPSPVIKNLLAHSAKLGWILVNKKIISQAQLNLALKLQFYNNKKLGELLVEQELISREELEQALKEQYWRRNGFWVI